MALDSSTICPFTGCLCSKLEYAGVMALSGGLCDSPQWQQWVCSSCAEQLSSFARVDRNRNIALSFYTTPVIAR